MHIEKAWTGIVLIISPLLICWTPFSSLLSMARATSTENDNGGSISSGSRGGNENHSKMRKLNSIANSGIWMLILQIKSTQTIELTVCPKRVHARAKWPLASRTVILCRKMKLKPFVMPPICALARTRMQMQVGIETLELWNKGNCANELNLTNMFICCCSLAAKNQTYY